MAQDESVPAHLRLGALKQLAVTGRQEKQGANGQVSGSRPREDGLPDDPLLEQFPDAPDEHGRPRPPDPMADLDWELVVGRPPHHLYARVLVCVPFAPGHRDAEQAKVLLDAEARFLRECRNRGIEGADDVSERRVRRRQKKRRSG